MQMLKGRHGATANSALSNSGKEILRCFGKNLLAKPGQRKPTTNSIRIFIEKPLSPLTKSTAAPYIKGVMMFEPLDATRQPKAAAIRPRTRQLPRGAV